MDESGWDRWAWMDALDPKLVERYPLQIANCERIDQNDAVYIFDEVGIGKTITAGLMALHYLFQHYDDPAKRVLVITTPALARGGGPGKPLCQQGMYLSDWSRLPFEELRLSHRIDIINNNYANLKNVNDYSFVIIDEAHTFLTSNTRCRSNLIGCYYRAGKYVEGSLTEKVAFLTATPIKMSFGDLQQYRSLACFMLRREWTQLYAQNLEGAQSGPDSGGWAEAWTDRLTREQESGVPICAKFDTREPVTRYFKEIVERTAQFSEGRAKALPRRHEPELWKYGDGITRQEALLKGLKDARAEDRFIIFVKYVNSRSDGARELKRFLQRNGFAENDVAVVTGQYCSETVEPEPGTKGGRPEYSSLSLYTGENPKRRPKILIMTYQIGETGVNLPTFHYVVNYQIPSYPSALEQRFGRIDRMTNEPHEIHACYLVSKEGIDTSTMNFCQAVRTYLGGLLPYLPAKNALVSPAVLQFCISKEELYKHFIQELTRVSKMPGAFEAYLEHWEDPEAEINPQFYELIELCDEHMGCPDFNKSSQFQKAVEQMLENLKSDAISPEMHQKSLALIAPLGGQSIDEQNAILYAVNMEDIKQNGILSAEIERITAKDCADEIMNGKGKDAYREFCEKTVGRHRADEASRAKVIQSCAAKISECLDGLVKEETELEAAYCGASTQEAKDAFRRENSQRIGETIERHSRLSKTDDVYVLCYLGCFYSGDLWSEWSHTAGNDAEESFVKAAVSWAKDSAELGELSAAEVLKSGAAPENCTWVIESFLARLGKYKFPDQLEQIAAYRLKLKLAKLYENGNSEKAFQQYMELIKNYRWEAKKDYVNGSDNPFSGIVKYFKKGMGTADDLNLVDGMRRFINIGKMRLGNARSRYED